MADCTVCSSGVRARVESLSVEGVSPTNIARLLDSELSISAIRRHLISHYKRPAIAPAERALDSAQAVGGLFDLWDSAEAVRIDAERRGDAVTALRAGEQGVRVMGALSRQYGVTSKVVAENLEYAVQLHRTVGLVGEAHPAAVRAMAVTAHAEGFTQVGKDLTRFAEVVEARQKEKTA